MSHLGSFNVGTNYIFITTAPEDKYVTRIKVNVERYQEKLRRIRKPFVKF